MMLGGDGMTISELMRETRVSRKAVYLYESRGLLIPYKCESNGYREYNDDDLRRLRMIVRLRELDVPLSIIGKILKNPDHADIYLQACMEDKKRELQELSTAMGRLYTVIRRMPPNGSLEDFNSIAAEAIPEQQEKELIYKIQQDYPHEYTRRILMNGFEAFLDRPIDTVAKKEVWQRILELNEEAITEELLEGYAVFYGTYSAEELEQDFLLRRRRVVSIAGCRTEEDFRGKAAEVFRDAEYTVGHAEALSAWKAYHEYFVRPMQASYEENDEFHTLIGELSPTLSRYVASFQRIAGFLDQLFGSAAGRKVTESFETSFPDFPRDFSSLTYFDFYNYSLREIMQNRR